MNRIHICGEIIHSYEQTIELSDEELQKLRKNLDLSKIKGDQGINNFLAGNYGDVEPIDWINGEWSACLIDSEGLVIEYLDAI